MPIIQTLEDTKKAVRARLIQLVSNLHNNLVNDRTALLTTIWHNGRGLTPEQALTCVDLVDAAKLAAADVLLRTCLNFSDAGSAPSPIPEGYTCTFKDGSNATVDVTPELTALLVKLTSIQSVVVAPVVP